MSSFWMGPNFSDVPESIDGGYGGGTRGVRCEEVGEYYPLGENASLSVGKVDSPALALLHNKEQTPENGTPCHSAESQLLATVLPAGLSTRPYRF